MRTEAILCVILVAAIVVISVIEPSFYSYETLALITILSAELGFIALGQAFVIASGEIDLSAAAVLSLSLWVYDGFATGLGFSLPLAVIPTLILALCIGFIHGYLSLKMDIPGFIVTFVGMVIWKGILTAITQGEHEGYLGDKSTWFTNFLQGYFGPVPGVFLWFIVFTAAFTVLLTRTRFGNHVLAVGGNLTVARNIGVRIERTKILCFMLSSLMAALGGIVMIIEYKVMQPTAGMVAVFGAGLEFEAIAVCMMSGIAPRGGRTSFFAIFIATLAYSSFKSGLVLFGLPGYWYLPFTGIMTFILVALHLVGRKKD